LKVAFVANTSWNIFNFRKSLVNHFVKNGDEVYILAPRDEYSNQIIEWGVIFIETPLEGTGSNPIKDLSYLRLLIQKFREIKPDVSLSFTIKSNIYSSIAGIFAKVKTICNVSGLGTVFLVKGLTGKVAILLYKVAFRFSSYVFFQNEDDKLLFLKNIPIDEKKTGVLPGSGIELDKFQYSKPTIGNPIKVLMISRVIIEKGVREYAMASSKVNKQKFTFTLVGKFDEDHARSIEKRELDAWISKGDINYLTHSDDIRELIKQSEIIILPSYREGTPRTLLEGGAIGRTLLTSDVPGCKEVVEDGVNGFLFRVKDHQSIVEALEKYRGLTYEQKLQMSIDSRNFIENKFDVNIVINKYLKAIDTFQLAD